jgi:hypothetical protein
MDPLSDKIDNWHFCLIYFSWPECVYLGLPGKFGVQVGLSLLKLIVTQH